MIDLNKLTFTAEYCRCRHIPYKIIHESLYIKRNGKFMQECYSLYNLTYRDIITMIDKSCEYDIITTFYIGG